MPYGDGIDRKYSFSLTDFHDFDHCSFRFFVFHHFGLGKKYELAEGNYNMALGSLLDETLKLFHKTKSYGKPPEYILGLIKASCNKMINKVSSQSSPSFYSAIEPFLDEKLCQKALEIFTNYYQELNQKINESFADPGFCEWIIEDEENSKKYKLWGGPDALEMGKDDIPEVVDYKYRADSESGKENIDMELMPKMYILLCLNKLKSLNFKKARFRIRFWLDSKEDNFFEDFDLDQVQSLQEQFKQKILKILQTQEVSFCEKPFCKVCHSPRRSEFLRELVQKGVSLINCERNPKGI